jgi:hypothetical protein
MIMDNQVPEKIAGIIEAKLKGMEEERLRTEEAARLKREGLIALGSKKYRACYEEALLFLPDWLMPYLPDMEVDGDTLESFGCKRLTEDDFHMVFRVPGLAPMMYAPKRQKDWAWKAFEVKDRSCSNWEMPEFVLGRANWTDIETAILAAHIAGQLMIQEQELFRQESEKDEEQRLARAEREMEQTRQAICGEEKERQEMVVLFSAFDDDPVAVLLMKAFLAIGQERRGYRDALDDLEVSLEYTQEHCEAKAKKLARQVKDAERQAEEERRRASDLEDDLAKAKKNGCGGLR